MVDSKSNFFVYQYSLCTNSFEIIHTTSLEYFKTLDFFLLILFAGVILKKTTHCHEIPPVITPIFKSTPNVKTTPL